MHAKGCWHQVQASFFDDDELRLDLAIGAMRPEPLYESGGSRVGRFTGRFGAARAAILVIWGDPVNPPVVRSRSIVDLSWYRGACWLKTAADLRGRPPLAPS
jgi:hypothetical protein